MAKPSPWPVIHAERKALAADLASLSEEQWATPSLAAGWTVREVLGHMTATAATDSDWTAGSGPEVAGPAIAIVLAMTGRAPGLDQLAGDGVATLRSRM